MMTNEGGTVRYHRAEWRPTEYLPWSVQLFEGGGWYKFSQAEGEAMGLTPPEPAPLDRLQQALDAGERAMRSEDSFITVSREWLDELEDAARTVLRDARQDPQPASDTIGGSMIQVDPLPYNGVGLAAAYEEHLAAVAHRTQSEQDDTPGIDFDALPDGTKLRHVRLFDATRIKADGRWWFPASNGALHTAADPIPGNWEVVYQPAPPSPGECLRGLLAGRDDTDELIERVALEWSYPKAKLELQRMAHVIGDAAREVHG